MNTQIFALLANRAPAAVEAEPVSRPEPIDGESSFEGIYSEMVETSGNGAAHEVSSTETTPAEKPEPETVDDAGRDESEPEEVNETAVAVLSPEIQESMTLVVAEELTLVAEAAVVRPIETTVPVMPASSEEVTDATQVVTVFAEAETSSTSSGHVVAQTTSVLPELPVNAEAEPVQDGSTPVIATAASVTETVSVDAPVESVPETGQPQVEVVYGNVLAAPDAPEAPAEAVAAETGRPAGAPPANAREAAPTPELPLEEQPVERPAPTEPFAEAADREEAPKAPSTPFEVSESSEEVETTEAPVESDEVKFVPSAAPATSVEQPIATEPVPTNVETIDRPVETHQGEDKGTVELGPVGEGTGGVDLSEVVKPAPTPELNMAQFVDRVVRFVRTMVGRNESSLEMRLNPPELGSVKLSMTMKAGELRMALQTSTEAARQVIAQNLDGLRSALVQHGFEVDRLDVSVGEQFAEGQTAQSDPEPEHFARGDADAPSETEDASDAEPVLVSVATNRYLDLVA